MIEHISLQLHTLAAGGRAAAQFGEVALAAPLAALRAGQTVVAAAQAAAETPLNVERHVNQLLREIRND